MRGAKKGSNGVVMDFFSSPVSWIMVVVWIAPAVGRFSLTSRIIFNPFSSSTEHDLPISLPLCPSFPQSFHRVPGVASITTTILLCWNSIIADIQVSEQDNPPTFLHTYHTAKHCDFLRRVWFPSSTHLTPPLTTLHTHNTHTYTRVLPLLNSFFATTSDHYHSFIIVIIPTKRTVS